MPRDYGSPVSSESHLRTNGASILSPRERQVLELTSHGLTNHAVARSLNVSVHAVKFHLSSIYRKLGVANRTEAVVTFLRDDADVRGHEERVTPSSA
jgi:DNA-binding NarL/FixJ family response regulator